YKIDSEKIFLVLNKIDISQNKHTSKNILRDDYGFSHDDKLIIYAGRLDVNKGIVNLLRAFKKLLNHIPNAKLIIAGSGDYNTVLSEIKPIWSKVYLTGFIEKEELYNLYRLSDLGVVPSYFEEFGYVALEMMYNGLSVLVNDVGGLHEQAKRSQFIHAVNMTELSSEQLASEIKCKLLYPERNLFLKMNKEQLNINETMGIVQIYKRLLT
ncbi:MAG: glycosyltransferase family 4 protein, partial [Paramuribaculum sp.]|nr:glycosyltransferase family 4 protein [Paramuribaculum sp.]